jgi:hypothetical protein
LLALLVIGSLFGDVTYDQSVRYTGGTLPGTMRKMAGNADHGSTLRAASQDQKFTVYVKGPKMARIGTDFSWIYDLDAGTVTTLDNQKRTYSKLTFEEMRQQMNQVQQRATKDPTSNVEFDVKSEKTGQTRTIDGRTASEIRITLTSKSAGAKGRMVVTADLWLIPLEPATREIVNYSRRLSVRFGETFSGSPMLGAASAGIGAAMKEAAKLDGYSVLTDVDVSGVSSPLTAAMGSANNDANAPLVKAEIQSSNFVLGTVDDSKFAIPAGYMEQTNGR